MITLREALDAATTTRDVVIGNEVLQQTPEVFRKLFGDAPAILVADNNTFTAAGREVLAAFQRAGGRLSDPHIFADPALYAEHKYVEQLEEALRNVDAVPVAVGSGTLNDLTKLASHRVGKPYMVVATAASMDGYTAFGASITYRGSKQTFDCPAPVGVVADLEVVRNAPDGMNSSGYADLLAKIAAGADWILSDALGVEPIDSLAWRMVQEPLRGWLADPEGIRRRNPDATANLLQGLMMGGFAMQHCRSSRPASGADHQFSHLWDMQHLTLKGKSPSHGFKVGIGTIASIRLYEQLIELLPAELDIDQAVSAWRDMEAWERVIRASIDEQEIADKAVEEMTAKQVGREELRAQLEILRDRWQNIALRLREHLPMSGDVAAMLTAAGAPTLPEEIGVTHGRMRASYLQAFFIRRRFTVLDVAVRTGLLDRALTHIFAPQPNTSFPESRNE